MSVTDPQHMPPRCCTQDHIPLKHVDRLFDTKFKMKWNKRYQEYTTKNRIYCPAKGCGEWIKPSNIHTDQTSGVHPKKYGKCGRCKLKVCCKCNGKWHAGKDCPKDEETKKFAEIAKKEGWQRCFNCSAMVELKEGCNHMTCRCTAEFCMICGLKWKTCDCPWFNYEAVENDRLNHMNIPQARRAPEDAGRNVPRAYHEELGRRRDQERRDEALARRLQVLGLDDDDDDEDNEDDHLAGAQAGLLGIGNAAGHFLNQDFVRRATNVLGRNFGQADNAANHLIAEHRNNNMDAETPAHRNQPMPHAYTPVHVQLDGVLPTLTPLRQHSTASRRYNNASQTRVSERVVPRRTTTDYATEAAHHRPDVEGGLAQRQRTNNDRRRHSTMAGWTANTEQGRIGTWLDHVEEDHVEARRVIPVR
ncbi:MAG: hypothetical protein M1830_000202 [Pleopsidium flavum]|nr:MAG: hypothetical protein M1830_000202 [Pleopsidium flavum]